MSTHDWRYTGGKDERPGHEPVFEARCNACKEPRFTFTPGPVGERAFFAFDSKCEAVIENIEYGGL